MSTPRPRHVGAQQPVLGQRRPRAPPGSGSASSWTFSCTSPRDRAPVTTAATAGWASGNCSAAAASGTPKAVADLLELGRPLEDLGRGRRVVERRAGPRIGEDPAVEHASGDDRDVALLGQRKQFVQRDLVEQRVATGEQDAVEIGPFDQEGERRGEVHAGADRTDDRRRPGAPPGRRSAPSSASYNESSGSWIKAMSIRSIPSRSRLDSNERIVPS